MTGKQTHSPSKRRKTAGENPEGPLFATKLGGDAGPSLATAQALCALSAKVFELQPWEVLEETDLILVKGVHRDRGAARASSAIAPSWAA